MGNLLRGLGVLIAAAFVTISSAWAQSADPPARVGRLAYVNGSVSFHDRDETNWQPAVVNYPLTSGDALWTEPNGRAEVFVGATRLRMQGGTQLETLSLTDDQLQLRISQGRIDVKTVALQPAQEVEVLTPRGSVMLVGDGDYMIEAGTTDDATRVGVRAGSARVIAANGSALIVRAGEIGVLSGTAPPVFETVRMATPPMPPEWAPRDRQIVMTQSVQYLPAGMTGVETLDYYGTWSTIGDYGRVWSPRTVPVGWAPYRQGRWRWIDPWGWTWIDDQPWGFAPSHYGRWVNHRGRWYWVPPHRQARPVYAPAVVGFVDVAAAGAVLAISASIAPVGWFPLGPREVYVPPYTADRAYIRRLNAAYVPSEADIDRRIDYAERYRDSRFRDDQRRADPRRDVRPGPGDDRDRPTFINQRFATVVPQQAFLRGDRVGRAAIRVAPDRLARVRAAPVAAPTVATSAPATAPTPPGKAPDGKPGQPPAAAARPPAAEVRRAPLADIPVLGRPDRRDHPAAQAPGPQISRTQPAAPGSTGRPAERQLPHLRTRDGREVERTAPSHATPAAPPVKPAEPPKPNDRPVATPPGKPGDVSKPDRAGPAHPPAAKPDDRPKAAEPPKPPMIPPTAAQPPNPPAAPPKAAPPPSPAAPPKAAQPPSPPAAPPAQQAKPPAPSQPTPHHQPPPRPQQAHPPAHPAQPPHPAPQATPPAPPKPQQAHPAPPPQPSAHPPQQARPPAPPAHPPQQARPPAPPPRPQGKPPEQARQPPGRDRDDKGGDDRRR
jgi:hypothetical protein